MRPTASLRRRPLGGYRYVRLRWRVLFAVLDAFGALATKALGMLRAIGGRKTAPRSSVPDPSRILVVQLDHLGDAVLSTVLFAPLRQRYPQASIEVLAAPWNREVFASIPEVDRVEVLDRYRFGRDGRMGWIFSWLGCVWRLRRRKPDLAIDVLGEFPVVLLMWLCGARRRLGWGSGGGGFLLTDRPTYVAGRPEIESRRALLAALDIPLEPDEACRATFAPSAAVRRRVAEWFEHLDQELPRSTEEEGGFGPRIVLHVGAGTAAKNWRAESWRDLVGRMIDFHRAQVVLVGSRKERIITRRILGEDAWPRVLDWTGWLSVEELAAVLEHADVMVGADSGPAHLAAAVGTPTVVLFSGTNHARQWAPPGPDVCVLRHPVPCSPCHREQCPLAGHPCMHGLSVERVAEAVGAMLDARWWAEAAERDREGVRP